MKGNRRISRVLCLLLAAAMLLGLAACKKNTQKEDAPSTTTTKVSAETATTTTVAETTGAPQEEPEETGTLADVSATTEGSGSATTTKKSTATTGKKPGATTTRPTTTKKTVPTTAAGLTRPYFDAWWTGNAKENQQALEYALKLIDQRGWRSLSSTPFAQAQAVAKYVAESISYATGDRMWTAYAGLVKKQGTCWAYANSFLFIAKELGLNVKRVTVREGTMQEGWVEVYNYETKEPLGSMGFASDHMGIEFVYKGKSFYVETQVGGIFLIQNGIYYRLEKAPA